jgi:hypothetical protein
MQFLNYLYLQVVCICKGEGGTPPQIPLLVGIVGLLK